jgi:hypothetical protein
MSKIVLNKNKALFAIITIIITFTFACALGGKELPDKGIYMQLNPTPLLPSDLYESNVVLNSTIGYRNYSVSLSGQRQHEFQLAMPAGCNFDLYLYNPSHVIVASATTPSTSGSNESFVYYNSGFGATFTVQVDWVSGNGAFNLSIEEIPNLVAPVLSSFGVDKNNTIIFTPYTFFTNYSDADGYAPVQINVVINNVAYPLTRNVTAGGSYLTGVQYYRIFTKLEAGSNLVKFNTTDGSWVTQTSTFTVLVNKPSSILVTTASAYVQPFDASYNADGRWTNSSSAWEIITTDYRSPSSCMHIEDAPLVGVSGNLNSPLFDLTSSPHAFQVILGYNLVGYGYLAAQVNMSGTWVTLFTFDNIAGVWTRLQLNVSQYRDSFVQFRIHFTGIGLPFTRNYLSIDDFQVRTLALGTASFSNPLLTPFPYGTEYDIFRVYISYKETNNVFPTELYLSVMDGLTDLNPKEVNFLEQGPNDWDISNGKTYYCDFQLFDNSDPYLICWSDRIFYSLYVPFIGPFFKPDTSETLDQVAIPYSIDFETDTGYYLIDDPVLGQWSRQSNGNSMVFTTGASTGNINDNIGTQVGVVTPWLNLTSNVQIFLDLDVEMTTILPGNAFFINITTDAGTSWTTIYSTTAALSGHLSINLTEYKGNVCGIRLLLDTVAIAGIFQATLTLDNITIFEVDLTRPTMIDPSISNGQWLFGVVNVDMTVKDVGFGVDHVIVRVDGIYLVNITTFDLTKASFSLDTMRYGNGDHEVVIIVVDESGNQNTYTIVVHIDNTPYWLYAVIAGAVAVLAIITVRRRKGIKTAVQRKVRKEAIPPTDVAKKILEVTNIFRRISAADLAKKLAIKGVTSDAALSYLRYMIAEGMIKGDLDGDVFVRMMSGKMKAVLATKETAILEYLRGRKQASMSEMIKDLHMEMVRKEALEDFIMGLVVAGKLACYFEEDTIYSEDEAAAKVKELLPEPEPEPAPRSTSHVAKKKEAPKEVETEEPETPADAEKPVKKAVKEVKIAKEDRKPARTPPTEAPAKVEEPKEEAPAKAPWTMADKKDDIIRLLSSRESVKFDEIKKEFALHESTEEIEEYLFDLIKSRAIKGVIEDDSFSSR